MSADDTIHDDIREIRTALTTLVGQGARTEQMYVGLNERLYGAQGAMPVIFKAIGDIKTDVINNKSAGEAAIVAVKADVVEVGNKIKSQRIYAVGLATGVSLALNGLKLGVFKLFHF